MSASLKPEDKNWRLNMIPPQGLGKLEQTIMETIFEEETDYDLKVIEKQMKEEAEFKKTCLCLILVAPFEFLARWIVMGRKKALRHWQLVKLYKAYYKGNVSLEVFQDKLGVFMSSEK